MTAVKIYQIYIEIIKNCEVEGKPAGEIHTYRKIFNKDYNISFFVPKKDMCEFCTAFENMDQTEKEINEWKYLEHHSEKELSRIEKNEDKQKVQENFVIACYDLQAVLPLPMCKTSAFYYKSKLNVCNFTICELNKDSCHCYVWSEVDGLRGANEIGSCVLNLLKKSRKQLMILTWKSYFTLTIAVGSRKINLCLVCICMFCLILESKVLLTNF